MDFNQKVIDQVSFKSVSMEESQLNELRRTCADCQTTKTPLWRGGPTGPKSLCNACGIRYRKRRRALLGLNSEAEEKKKERRKNKLGVSFKLRLLAMGKDVFLQKSMLKRQRKLGEEEEAAVLLMALSSGFVYS
ncbi:GATA transcription factor 15-like isoform X1 [Tasmannia lanceolata]|uniref:GATA transcription factor 15-like isoform X1 n=1 Tax=Tasmannia lanceolata TaxID=3420 RepID=UPI0040642DDA